MNQAELQNEIKQFLKESNWDNIVQEQITQIETFMPSNPWSFVYEQPQSLAHFLSFISIYNQSKTQLQCMLYELLVDQYQMTKVKRNHLLNAFTLLFSGANLVSLQKHISENYDETLTIEKAVQIIMWILRLREVNDLAEQMKKVAPLTMSILTLFEVKLDNSNELYRMIEQYKLHESIGQGEFGKVYRATNLLSQQVVAIKIVDVAKFNETPKLLELSMQEIEVLQKLQHCPYVVKFIELIKTAHQYYFVYEYCSGGPLDKLLLLQGHFTERKSLEIIYQLIQAFKSLREHSIIHRDLKPSNILIHNGVYKLADFGFCKPIKNDVTATMLGSPIYMAPEVLRGLTYNSKADIWSLGAVLYELLIGKCPFEEKSIAKLITAQDETDWMIPPQFHFTKQTVTLMKSMLVKDPNKRCTWEYLFKIPLKNDGEFNGDLELYTDKPEPQNVQNNNVSILQEIVNERCKVQFMCQTAHSILEQSQNKDSPLIAYYLLLLANNRGQQLISVIKNQCTTATEYFSLNKLSIHLKQQQDSRLSSNFEFTRLMETIQKEIDQLSIGLKEYKSILDGQLLDIKDNYRQNIKNYVTQMKQSNYVAFMDSNQDKQLLTLCVQILDALQVDKFLCNNVDPTMDCYLEIRSMTKKQLLERFESLI